MKKVLDKWTEKEFKSFKEMAVLQNRSDNVNINLAKLSMEGPTIQWFNLLRETEAPITWAIFKRAPVFLR